MQVSRESSVFWNYEPGVVAVGGLFSVGAKILRLKVALLMIGAIFTGKAEQPRVRLPRNSPPGEVPQAIAKPWHSDADHREFVSAGAAAGIAVRLSLLLPPAEPRHCRCMLLLSCACLAIQVAMPVLLGVSCLRQDVRPR